MRDAGRNWRRWRLKRAKKYAKIIRRSPKGDPKSMKSRGCVADVFLDRFGAALGGAKWSNRPTRLDHFGDHFWSIFDGKSPKTKKAI